LPMDQLTLQPRGSGVEMSTNAFSMSVLEHLSSVRERDGAEAFDKAATNLVTDVCAVMALEFGPERMLELFDSIEANFPQLSPTLTAY
jgi:hypothetical protein